MCFLASVGMCVHELAHRTRVFARMCLRVLRAVRECGVLKSVSWRMLGCARMRLRSARVCSHACVRASSVDFVCRVRVPAHICARACVRMCVFAHVKRIRDPARKLVRVKRDKGA